MTPEIAIMLPHIDLGRQIVDVVQQAVPLQNRAQHIGVVPRSRHRRPGRRPPPLLLGVARTAANTPSELRTESIIRWIISGWDNPRKLRVAVDLTEVLLGDPYRGLQ